MGAGTLGTREKLINPSTSLKPYFLFLGAGVRAAGAQAPNVLCRAACIHMGHEPVTRMAQENDVVQAFTKDESGEITKTAKNGPETPDYSFRQRWTAKKH